MKKTHIAYISIAALADCDLPLIKEMREWADIDYYLPMTGNGFQSVLFNAKIKNECNLYCASDYPELSFIDEWISPEHVFIMNMPLHHDYSPGNLKVVLQCIKKIRRENYDIIHVTEPLRYSFFPLYLFRNKMIMTIHDPIPHSCNYNKRNLLHRLMAFKLVKDFILLNRNQTDEFSSKYHIEKNHIRHSRLGVYYHLSKKSASKALFPTPYILFFGTINGNKGIEYLCEAMTRVFEKKPDLHLVIAGKGNFYFDISKYAQDPRVHIMNRFIIDEEQVSLIANCEMVVCPYIDATQSGVIMSAFGLNKPVIASNVGGLGEMLESGRHGLLVEPRNVEQLTQAILSMSDKNILKDMSTHIQEDYSSGKNSWHTIAEEMAAIYNDFINSRKRK
jgi:glycosyltransferase involved in cell wall biosynthesis